LSDDRKRAGLAGGDVYISVFPMQVVVEMSTKYLNVILLLNRSVYLLFN